MPGPRPARASARRGRTARPVRLPDTAAHDTRPDPLSASTAAEFVDVLCRYPDLGRPALLPVMAASSGQLATASTLHTALHSATLPRLEIALAVITGCGGDEEDRRRFATAWRRIQLGGTPQTCGSCPWRDMAASQPAAGT